MRIHWLQSRDGTAVSGDTDDGYEVDLNLCSGNDVSIDIYYQGRKVSSTRERGTLGQVRRRVENAVDRHRRRATRSVKAVDKRTAVATLRRLGYTRVRFLPRRSTTAYPIFSAVDPEGVRVYLRVSTRGTVREYDSAQNAMNDVLGREVRGSTKSVSRQTLPKIRVYQLVKSGEKTKRCSRCIPWPHEATITIYYPRSWRGEVQCDKCGRLGWLTQGREE